MIHVVADNQLEIHTINPTATMGVADTGAKNRPFGRMDYFDGEE
jgi:hypothetical protein